MRRQLRLYAIVAAMLALMFGVGMTSAAFACDGAQATTQCAGSSCDVQKVDDGCALACAPIAPLTPFKIESARSFDDGTLAPTATHQSGLVSRPIGPEPPPPRSAGFVQS